MLVVSDTTPLNYLILIGSEEVLSSIYGAGLVPSQVVDELMHDDTPELVRSWAKDLPAWIHVIEGDVSVFPPLDPGEAAALALAIELHADALLADDMEARLKARSLGIVTIGTVGILAAAHEASLLDFDAAIEALLGTSFRISDSVISAVRNTIPSLILDQVKS